MQVDERKATPRMIALLAELANERDIPEDARERLLEAIKRNDDPNDSYRMGFDRARTSISWFFRKTQPRPGVVPSRIQAMPKSEARNLTPATRAMKRDPATLPTEGVFRKGGEIYVIVPTRTEGRHKAKRLVKSPKRLTSSGETVDFDYVDAPGVIWALYEEDRLPVDEIREMLIQYRVCIYPGCYRTLRAAKSVAAGVGKRHAEKLGIPWGKKAK